MQLHQLSGSHRRKKRIGRGGKRGTTSGRGTKGQRSRAGRRIRPAARDLIIRIPKHRGFRHKRVEPKPFAVQLEAVVLKLHPLASGKQLAVDRDALVQAGLVPSRYRGAVKVLGGGTVDLALTLKGISASKGARMAIEKAGGRVIANNANDSK